ncbi:AraC family transcriptional regulator [Rhodanobacter sp. DHG33]|uniref:AraC family transcriptional regulator n=1 Tax=Rhodanobacter sp. DHG33 TaxID=2775921 RepID=UPI001784BEE4|nr:AraC family transcriptional regulator [Rhodanobacter sp. DHG33]MBD8899794.1 helix-turn-helix domain-containing protein [Rhodanobacter sp. DHG33]
MALPHFERPICEPVELAPRTPVRVERVRQGRGSAATDSFVHFHDAHELVLFGRVGGHFDTEDRRYALTPGCLAFIPSMRQHDFQLDPGARDWVLVQIEATAGETLVHAPEWQRLRQPFCARPGRLLRQRLGVLADWLLGLDAGDPLVLPLTALLLRAATLAPAVAGEKLAANARGLQRLRPAIDRLRRHPADAPGAEQAAALCAMSAAYFSRRFKQQVGMSWSDYVRTHRLHLAGRRLLETEQSIAGIATGLGFATPSHFGDLFLHRFGMTPGEYRRAGHDRSTPASPVSR